MTLQSLPWGWSWDPQVLAGIGIALFLYWVGVRYSLQSGLTRRVPWWRRLSFHAGLVTIVLALESPIDTWSETYLWAHMVQHELLLFAAPILLLVGAPLWPFWRAIPLGARRTSLRWVMQHPRPRRLGLAISRAVMRPRNVWVFFVGNFIVWHFPGPYDLALQVQPVHDLEHLLFLASGLLFWAQVIPSHPLKPRLSLLAQFLYTFFGGIGTGLVGMVLVFASTPIYPHYVVAARTVGALPVMVDQTSAAGLMDLTSAIIFGTAVMILTWYWLENDEQRATRLEAVGPLRHRAAY